MKNLIFLIPLTLILFSCISPAEDVPQEPVPTNTPLPLPTNTSARFTGYANPPTPTNTPVPPSPTPTPTPTNTPVPVPITIKVNNYSFSPSNATVASGQTVTWVFETGAHSATTSAFNSGIRTMGQTYSFTFNTSGTFNYVCSIHSGMTGSVTVK